MCLESMECAFGGGWAAACAGRLLCGVATSFFVVALIIWLVRLAFGRDSSALNRRWKGVGAVGGLFGRSGCP